PGFFTHNVIVSAVDLFSAGYKLDRAKIFHTQLLDRVRALPGVESAALARIIPFSYNPPSSAPIEIDGYQTAPDEQPNADYVQVSEDYFSTLGIPLVAGREFTRNDDENAPPVTIINETMAAKYWPGKDPIGQRLKVKDNWMQIVGVAKNVKIETKLEPARSFFYVPVRQNFFVGNALLIRTRETPGAITNALAREVHALGPLPRVEIDHRRSRDRLRRGVDAYPLDGQPALQSQSPRSNRVRRSFDYFDRRCSHCLFSPRSSRHTDRSRPRAADLNSAAG